MMWLSERLKNAQIDKRYIKFSAKEAKDLIKSFVRDLGWRIVGETGHQRALKVIAENPQDSFLPLLKNAEPQVLVWRVEKSGQGARIGVNFELKGRFRRQLLQLLMGLFAYFLTCRIFGYLSGLAGDRGTDVFMSLVSALLIVATGVLLVRVSLVYKHEEMVQRFYQKVFELTGEKASLIDMGVPHPDLPLVCFGLLALAVIALSFFQPSIGQGFGLLIKALIFLVFVLFLGLAAIACSRGVRKSIVERGSGFVPNLAVGTALIVFSFTPIFAKSFLSFNNMYDFERLHDISLAFLLIVVLVAWSIATAALVNTPFGIIRAKTTNQQVILQTLGGRGNKKSGRIFTGFALAFWLGCTMVSGIGVFKSVNLLFDPEFYNPQEAIFVRASLLIFVVPILFITSVFVFRWRKEIAEVRGHKSDPSVQEKIRDICACTKTREPVVAITESPLITSSVSTLLGAGTVLRISRGALDMLQPEELEAVLAHEIGHVRKHSGFFTLLDVLSQWTLFGKGFLSIVVDSREVEHECDRFAVEYLEDKGLSKAALINGLNKALIGNSMLQHLAPSRSMLSFLDTGFGINGAPSGLRAKLKLLYEIYFGDLIVSYVHPTLEERIKRIEAIA